MTATVPRLLADCSVVMKWKLTSEPHASQARELLLDWKYPAVEVCVPDQLLTELANALLGAFRKPPPRLTPVEAREALQGFLDMPFTIYKSTGKGTLIRAFEIAQQYNQRAYDCVYVALAERKHIEFWTGDERLYNALHSRFSFIHAIGDYRRRRP
jgi:predicted nucleic acid-binding protein